MEKYEIGKKYTRTEIREIENAPGTNGKWVRGYFPHDGEMFIFSNFDGKASTGFDHGDTWLDENTFNWNASPKSSVTDKFISQLLDPACKSHLFTRKSEDNKKKGAPFTYQGLVTPIKVSGKDPVNIIWNVNNHVREFIEEDEKIPVSSDDASMFSKDDNRTVQKEREMIKRSSIVKNQALSDHNYQCEIDPTHATFLAKSSKKTYMEAHHIVPLSTQKYYKYKLDCVANISCLCPNCHRLIHLGVWDDKQPIIQKLYDTHKKDLADNGIALPSVDSLNIYYK